VVTSEETRGVGEAECGGLVEDERLRPLGLAVLIEKQQRATERRAELHRMREQQSSRL
jgi:hypothetical protein